MEVARANNGRWQSGQSGNPSGLPGRPLGSRTAFSQGFTRDLAEVWQATLLISGRSLFVNTVTIERSKMVLAEAAADTIFGSRNPILLTH